MRQMLSLRITNVIFPHDNFSITLLSLFCLLLKSPTLPDYTPAHLGVCHLLQSRPDPAEASWEPRSVPSDYYTAELGPEHKC